MGKASRKRKESRIKGMYSLTDLAVEKYLNQPLSRGSREYDDETSTEVVSQKVTDATEDNEKIFTVLRDKDPKLSSMAADMMATSVSSTLRKDFGRALQLGDYETIFIDNEKLFTLLSTSKVPDIDIREFIMENNIPHTVLPFTRYVEEYYGIKNALAGVPFIHMFQRDKEGIDMDEDHIDIKYIMKNCTVHMMNLLFYVPRSCSKYVIKVHLFFMYDENKEKFVYFHSKHNEGTPEALAADIQMNSGYDVIFTETLLDYVDDQHVDLAFGVLPCQGITQRVREATEGKDIYGTGYLTKYSSICKMICNMFINYILYRSTFPEFIVDGLPEHKIVSPTAQRINIPSDIFDSFEGDNVNLKDYKNKMPHYRRGYFRVLQSEKFTNKRFKTVWVKPTFIHKEMFNSSMETVVEK